MEEGAVHKDKSTVPYWPCTTLWRKPRRRRVLIQVKNTNPPPHLCDFTPLAVPKQNTSYAWQRYGSGRHNRVLLTATLSSALHSIPTARDDLCTLLKHNPQQNELEATPNEELTGSYKYKQARSNKGGKCHLQCRATRRVLKLFCLHHFIPFAASLVYKSV